MKKVSIIALVILVTAALLIWCNSYSLFEWGVSNLYKEDTVYGAGYSEKAFNKVKNGMSVEEVENLLGKPLSQKFFPEIQKYIWYYSKAGKLYDNYRVRLIYFNREKRVEKEVRKYYLD